MALSPDLVEFVKESLGRGIARPDHRGRPAALRRVAARSDSDGARLRFEDAEYPIPVPRPAISVKPREAFLYAVLFAALFVSAYNLGDR